MLTALSPLTSCMDNEYEIPEEELYAREFIKEFGVNTGNHTWSMARNVKASITLRNQSAGTLEIYTDVTVAPDCRKLAAIPFNGTSATGCFDVEAGTQSVYVRVLDESDQIIYAATIPVANGSVTGCEAGAKGSRAGADNAADIQIQDLDIKALRIDPITLEYFQSCSYETYPELDKATTFPIEINGTKVYYLNYNAHKPYPINGLKQLSNLHNVTGTEYRWSEVKPVFVEYEENGVQHPGVFAEGKDHIDQYYHNAAGEHKLDPEVTFHVRKDGPVSMECVWRGTSKKDYFGYYYYPNGKDLTPEDLWNIPKYVFLSPNEITNTSSLTQLAYQKQVWDQSLGQNVWVDPENWDWDNLDGMSTSSCSHWQGNPNIRGTKYDLAYFGEDYQSPATYNWPKDVQIGYFLITDNERIFFSDCKLNYYLTNYGYKNEKYGPLERPFAAKFTYDHRTFVGFGDMSGDCDLNDLVFIVSNVYPTPEDITPPSIVKPKDQSWTLACEDLGSTADFDFNDIVIDIEYVAGSGEITFIPRAAGGTLDSDIYFNEEYIGEIHSLLGAPSGQMTNTGLASVDPSNVTQITMTVPADWTMTQAEGGFADLFRIHTLNDNGHDGTWLQQLNKLEGGCVIPQMLLLRDGWEWPTERTHITKAYNRFNEWTRDQDEFEWDSHKDSSVVLNIR